MDGSAVLDVIKGQLGHGVHIVGQTLVLPILENVVECSLLSHLPLLRHYRLGVPVRIVETPGVTFLVKCTGFNFSTRN